MQRENGIANDRRRVTSSPWVGMVLVAFIPLAHSTAYAGGGPENLALVVNERSWASKTVANYYCKLRNIPPRNVIYLDWGSYATVDVNTFRTAILEPVIDQITERGLAAQIDYIAYAPDIPYRVNVTSEVGNIPLHKAVGRNAAINGLTYLHQLVRAKSPVYLGLQTNFYRRPPILPNQDSSSHGFRSRYGWDKDGEIVKQGGLHYILSAMLGVTYGRANSVQEIIRYLTQAQQADGTRPSGTIYYADNLDIRTRARRYAPGAAQEPSTDEYAAAVQVLRKMGIRAKLVPGVLPSGARDIQGLMTGYPSFDWEASNNRIQPGAICENFTSYGGIFTDAIGNQGVASQTPLSVFLRYGAAGSSGTVSEPMSHQQKFPLSSLQVHYARGCSLAESFYQSLYAPWQLLIVGDPLCQPWARFPKVTLDGVGIDESISGHITMTPKAENPGGQAVDRFEFFVDGRLASACKAGDTLSLDTTQLPDGYHEFRLVGIESGPIETQGRVIIPVWISNHERKILADSRPRQQVALGEELRIAARARGAGSITFVHNGKEIGKVENEEGVISIDSSVLGQGRAEIQAIGVAADGKSTFAVSRPVVVEVRSPVGMPSVALPVGARLSNGLNLTFGNRSVALVDTTQPNWFKGTGIGSDEDFEVSGYFGAQTDDIHQFRVGHAGQLEFSVDGKRIYQGQTPYYQNQYLPVSLAKGTHHIEIRGKTDSGTPMFDLSFGGPEGGVQAVDGTRFQHVP